MIERAVKLEGVWAAVLTPLDESLRPDPARAREYYAQLLEDGCDGLNVLGTTGEAMSLGTRSRLDLMESLASSEIPLERAMVGTGAASLDDAAALTRAAFNLGFAAALVMPPFYYREGGDEGVVRFFDALFQRTGAPPRSVLLYNFPKMSGVTFSLVLVDRLIAEFPEVFAGMKDSSNDRGLQRDLIASRPDFRVFPSSEEYLPFARTEGTAGCISATVALSAQLAHHAYRTGDITASQSLSARRHALSGVSLIPAMRYVVARSLDDDAWERVLPPLVALNDRERAMVDEALSRCV